MTDYWSLSFMSLTNLCYPASMANPEHLAKLNEGVSAWNEWRVQNRDIDQNQDIDVDLSEAILNKANLCKADLSGADLSGAYLLWANLSGANLIVAKLRGAMLRKADLSRTFLYEADLTEVGLFEANLHGADLRRANLSRADLRWANLSEAELRGANLSGVDLRSANLQRTYLDKCIATDVKLWETQRAGWSIKGIICERAYWDKEAKKPTAYAPGEFERLYSDQTCIELHYPGGVSTFELNTLPALLHHLASQHSGANIRLKSIEETGGGAKISISVSDANPETTEKIKAVAMQVVDAQLALRNSEFVEQLKLEMKSESERIIEAMLSKAEEVAKQQSPTYQIENLGTIYALALPSGDAKVEVHQTINDNTAVLALLKKIKDHRADLELSAAKDKKLEAELQSATAELQKPDPDKSILSKSIGFIQKLATEAMTKAVGKLGESAVTDWHTWLDQLSRIIHHWK
jgi:uncharacterized protein YjbI with pentapeptide repeats